jgi:hypothetical protein
MASKPTNLTPPGPSLPEAKAKSGNVCSLACNLPHGLLIVHDGKKLTVAGANHPKAIQTGLAFSAKWGITHEVDEEWFDHWCANAPHAAVKNGHIVKNTRAKIEDHAEQLGDGVKTSTDQIDPTKAGPGVETKTEED